MGKLFRRVLALLAQGMLWIFPVVLVTIIVLWGFSFWPQYNPLAKYGVTYDITSGDHAEFQTLELFCNRQEKRIRGPSITGDELYIQFEHTNDGQTPEIVIGSKTDKTRRAIIRFNSDDLNKPPFEVIENNMMGINVP